MLSATTPKGARGVSWREKMTKLMEVLDNYYTSRVLLWIGKEEPRPIDNPEYGAKLNRLKDIAISQIKQIMLEAVGEDITDTPYQPFNCDEQRGYNLRGAEIRERIERLTE
jgi:hypothetical protein